MPQSITVLTAYGPSEEELCAPQTDEGGELPVLAFSGQFSRYIDGGYSEGVLLTFGATVGKVTFNRIDEGSGDPLFELDLIVVSSDHLFLKKNQVIEMTYGTQSRWGFALIPTP